LSKTTFVRDITGNQHEVNDLFVVTKKGTYTAKNNTKYMMIGLKDATGSIEGRVWERVDELEGLFEKGDIVSIRSKARVYQDRLQLHVTDIRKLDADMAVSDIAHFYPAGEKDRDSLEKEYAQIVKEIGNPWLTKLLTLEGLPRQRAAPGQVLLLSRLDHGASCLRRRASRSFPPHGEDGHGRRVPHRR